MPKKDNLVQPFENESNDPIAKNEDVKFDLHASDNDDLEALIRARKADTRVERKNTK